jgi:hypothetical protein
MDAVWGGWWRLRGKLGISARCGAHLLAISTCIAVRRGHGKAGRRSPVRPREVLGVEVKEREAGGRQLVQSLHARWLERCAALLACTSGDQSSIHSRASVSAM